MKRGDVIHRKYLVIDALPPGGKSENARVSHAGEVFFLKRFATPRYPFDESMFAPDKIPKLKVVCSEFERRHIEILELLDRPVLGGGNLVKPTDFFREKGTYYKVYPFVASESSLRLQSATIQEKTLFTKTFLLCVRELHARNIVHSDLKPDNVLVERRPVGPVAKLIDFDEAYVAGKPPKRPGGDISYASPELSARLDGGGGDPDDLTTASDIFSAGLVLHQVLNGKAPTVTGPGGGSIGDAVREGATLSFDKPDGFPASFSSILSATGQADPRQRPSVDDLLEALGVDRLKAPPRPITDRPARPGPEIKINVGRRAKPAGT